MPEPSETRPPVVVVTGPTAAGKTPLAIEIAERFDGEILSADSLQVYRYLDIGSAKPTPEQRARVPHHCIDLVPPDVPYDAGCYARDARAAAAQVLARGRIPVLAGGTGLYIRAFLEGLLDAGSADPELRASLEREHARAVEQGDPFRLHRRLAERDPEAADRIHPRDLRRIVRALEIAERTGDAVSALRREHGFGDRPYRPLHLIVDPGREALNERIDRRCRSMVEGGLLQEVRALRARKYGPELKPMQAIGYRHMHPVVEGHGTLASALEAMQRDTRRFARRQRTWLRRVPETIWHSPDEKRRIFERVEAFLKGALEPLARAPQNGTSV